MRLRFWRTRDEKIAHLLQRLREAQQGAVRLKLGNAELARTNAKIQELFSKNVVDRRRLLGLLRVRGHELEAARAELELLRNVATKAQAWRDAWRAAISPAECECSCYPSAASAAISPWSHMATCPAFVQEQDAALLDAIDARHLCKSRTPRYWMPSMPFPRFPPNVTGAIRDRRNDHWTRRLRH